jgi:hypothetical protein
MRLVLIEWEDSHTEGGWQRLDADLEDRAVVCRSVGWLVLDGEAVKIVAPHLNHPETGVPLQGSGVMHIPARAVLRMTDIAQHDATDDTPTSSSCSEPA